MEETDKQKKFHYTYEITNVNNGMKYIGSRSCLCLPCFDPYMSSSKYVKAAIKEDEHAHFVKIVLQEFPTREEAIEHEILLHNKFDVGKNPVFYNKAKQTSTRFDYHPDHYPSGPDSPIYGRRTSEETKQKLREIRLKNPVSPEAHKKGGETRRGKYVGKNNPRYGKPLSEEAKQKLSEAHRGKSPSDETREKQRNSVRGKNAGEKNGMFGKHVEERKRYIYITPMGEFTSTKKAAEILKYSPSVIKRKCQRQLEGYSLRLTENEYKIKKEELKKLLEKNLSTNEIAKILKIHKETVRKWKLLLFPKKKKTL